MTVLRAKGNKGAYYSQQGEQRVTRLTNLDITVGESAGSRTSSSSAKLLHSAVTSQVSLAFPNTTFCSSVTLGEANRLVTCNRSQNQEKSALFLKYLGD